MVKNEINSSSGYESDSRENILTYCTCEDLSAILSSHLKAYVKYSENEVSRR